ncbi:MAG: hypothetical protein ACYTF1_08015 [Planctomycetota bacterium]
MFRQLTGCLILLAVLVLPVSAQDAQQANQNDDIMSRPTKYGIRFTPGLARMMAQQFTKHSLVKHYKMDKEKSDQADEMVARRLMETAHAIDGPSQELIERFIEEQLAYQQKGGGGGFMPPTFGKEFADRLLPILPEIRNLIRNTAHDVRPMLAMKQQFKMAGELMAINTAFDAFEGTIKQWASGEVTKYSDPFHQSRKVEKDSEGVSQNLKNARKNAQSALDKGKSSAWAKYVKQAKEFYQLDDSQAASADSILREYLERAKNPTADEDWSTRFYRNHLWQYMILNLPNHWNHPLRALIDDEYAELAEPLEILDGELKSKIDSIPTKTQRQEAEERMETLLAEKGFKTQTQPMEEP